MNRDKMSNKSMTQHVFCSSGKCILPIAAQQAVAVNIGGSDCHAFSQ